MSISINFVYLERRAVGMVLPPSECGKLSFLVTMRILILTWAAISLVYQLISSLLCVYSSHVMFDL